MPTNYERREVAERLREFAADCKDEACDSMHFAMYACWSDKGVFEAYNTSEALARLADLIEPEPERTCRIEKRRGDWCCAECDAVVGTDDPESELYVDGNVIEMWSFCPNCGAKILL